MGGVPGVDGAARSRPCLTPGPSPRLPLLSRSLPPCLARSSSASAPINSSPHLLCSLDRGVCGAGGLLLPRAPMALRASPGRTLATLSQPHLLARCCFAHRSQGFARTAATSAPIFLAQPPPLPGTWPVPSEQGLTVCLTKPAVSTFPALSEERPGRNTAFCWHCRVRQLKFPLALGPRVRLLYGSPGSERVFTSQAPLSL